MILGTAGHVDHGKTALVRALTGVDTDRLAEEKRRGITIELGFAPLRLDDGETVGVVDVPGHEAFVRTMLAGATGVDLALLVIAADEGVMPQTREHLEILRLLGTGGGVVALTKCDLVDEEWLALVEDDVRSTLRDSPLAAAPLVRTSAVQGIGLAALRAAIANAVRCTPARSPHDLFRMPVDRAFSIHGTGTVVTGTVWSGTVERDTRVQVLPCGTRARVRAIETHGTPVQRAMPGSRTALALSGIDVSELPRGSVIVVDGGWAPARVMLGEVALLSDAPGPLGPRRGVRLHLGTADVEARVVATGGPVAPGERRQARIVLAEPIAARAGDRFVLRVGSPVATIGGGVVNDPLPGHSRPRPWTSPAATAAERLARLLAVEGARGVPLAVLPVRTGAPPRDIPALVAAPEARVIGDHVYSTAQLRALRERMLQIVDAAHAAEPLEPGLSLQRLRAQLGAPEALSDCLLDDLVAGAELRSQAGTVARAAWTPRLSDEQAAVASTLLDTLRRQGREPDAVSELTSTHGRAVGGILRHLERQGSVVQVEPDRFYHRVALEGMVGALRATLEPGTTATPATLRTVLGISRKYLIPFLEYCDRTGVTERSGEGRRLRGTDA